MPQPDAPAWITTLRRALRSGTTPCLRRDRTRNCEPPRRFSPWQPGCWWRQPAGCQAPARSEPLKPAADAATPAAAEVVEVVAAVRTTWPRIVHLQGSLLGDEHVVVGAKVAGRTHQVAVDLGTRVEQGAVLATLETEEFDLAVQEAQAQLEQVRVKLGLKPGEDEDRLDRRRVPAVVEEESLRNQARATLHRAQAMAPEGIVTAEELEQRQAEWEVAEARHRSALNTVEEQVAQLGVRRAALGLIQQRRMDAEVRAPFAGSVQQRHVAPGAYVQVGQPIVTLVRTDPLRFRGGVPERQALQVQEGQQATIRVEGQSPLLSGRVSRISPRWTCRTVP